MSRLRAVAGVATALLLMITGCAGGDALSTQDVQTGLGALRAEVIARHMRVLADDALEGRAAGTTGYQKAADYVARQFETLGLQPAGDAGSYFQSVPLRRSLINARRSRLVLHRDGRARTLVRDEHYVIAGDFERGTVDLKAPLVYVGYGVSAPELGYDDYEGIEVRGKALVMFQGAPASLPHNERAYYSSGSVKLRNAVERGAVGVIQIRTPRSRRTAPWPRVVRHAGMPSMRWEEDGEPHDIFPEIRLGALLSESGMQALFETESHTLEEVEAAVADSRPFSFDLKASVESHTVSRQASITSPNVAAILKGSDPALADEYVVFTAHLDHVGIGDPVDGDAIHNGAYDNASGVSIMLAIAAAYREMSVPPRRSLLFLAVTAEEKGLLGADYFVHHPTVPLDRLVADLNLDMVLMLHPLRDVIAFGAEHSSLADPMRRAARHLGIDLSPDPIPAEVLFVRSDQYPFVRQGIPSLFVVSGWDSGDPNVEGGELEGKWLQSIYHSPQDDMTQDFDFEAGARFGQVNFLVGYLVANQTERPAWTPGDFFGEKFGAARTPVPGGPTDEG